MLVPRLAADGSKTDEVDSADIIVQTGSYSYIAPDGSVISVNYIADENGFQAFGDHLPKASPIPKPIVHAMQNPPPNIQQLEEQPSQQLIAIQGKSHLKKIAQQ